MNTELFSSLVGAMDFAKAWIWLRLGIAGVYACVLTEFFGTNLAPVELYLKLVLIDFATGVVAATAHKRVSSKIAHCGVIKKLIGGLGAIALANLVDVHIGTGGFAMKSFGALLVGVEAISILENLAVLGIKAPAGVMAWARKQTGEEVEDEEQQKG